MAPRLKKMGPMDLIKAEAMVEDLSKGHYSMGEALDLCRKLIASNYAYIDSEQKKRK